jgi:2-octaprenylphenol hydroxylase
MVLVLEGFKHLFGSRNRAVAGLRNAGLALADRSGPVKHAIMRRAMGIAGDVPDLVRTAG